MRKVVCTAVVAGLLASCATLIPDNITRKYTDQVRLLNMVPVYPPREDLQVGDLFYISDIEGQDDKDVFEYLTTFPEMIDLAEQNLAGRVLFDKTVIPAKPGETVEQTDFQGGKIKTRGDSEGGNTLPIYVFPEVTARSSNTVNAGLLTPLVALGLFFGGATSVKLSFNDVRSYYVPKLQAQPQIKTGICGFLQSGQLGVLADVVRDREAKLDEDLKPFATSQQPVRKKRLVLVTRVYLTRSIDYSYSNARIRALAARSAAADPKDSAVNIVNVVGNSDALATALAQAAKVDNKADGLSVGSLSAFGLTVNRSFQQPVAVAYAGQEFDLPPDPRGGTGFDSTKLQADCASAHILPVKELSPDDGAVLRAMTSRAPPQLQ